MAIRVIALRKVPMACLLAKLERRGEAHRCCSLCSSYDLGLVRAAYILRQHLVVYKIGSKLAALTMASRQHGEDRR